MPTCCERDWFERSAVLGHSFGGHVAIEYALRYPERLPHLVLLDTAGDSHWSQQNAAEVAAKARLQAREGRAGPPLVQRRIHATGVSPDLHADSGRVLLRQQLAVARSRLDPRGMVRSRGRSGDYAGRHLLKGWTVMDRLSEIAVPTLVMAGRQSA
jgi:proline iminopeptidase